MSRCNFASLKIVPDSVNSKTIAGRGFLKRFLLTFYHQTSCDIQLFIPLPNSFFLQSVYEYQTKFQKKIYMSIFDCPLERKNTTVCEVCALTIKQTSRERSKSAPRSNFKQSILNMRSHSIVNPLEFTAPKSIRRDTHRTQKPLFPNWKHQNDFSSMIFFEKFLLGKSLIVSNKELYAR